MKKITSETIVKTLSEKLNIHEDTIRDQLSELASKVSTLEEGFDIKVEGIGIFRKTGGKLHYVPDPVLDMEINYEFAGQQPITLVEGKGSFFPSGGKTEDQKNKGREQNEFVNVSPSDDESSDDYDALLSEFKGDEPGDSDDESIDVIPEDKPKLKRFDFTDEPEPFTSEDDIPEKKKTQDKPDPAEEIKKTISIIEGDEEEEEIEDTPASEKPDEFDHEIEEIGDVIPSGKLKQIDDDDLFDDEDEKASDELAVEFTTLLKKMRDKADKANELESKDSKAEKPDVDAERAEDIPVKPVAKTEKPEPVKEEPKPVFEENEKTGFEPVSKPKPAEEDVKSQEKRKEAEHAVFRQPKQEPEPMREKPEPLAASGGSGSGDDNLPRLGGRTESEKPSRSKTPARKQTDNSTIGILIVILLLVFGLGAGLYFSGLLESDDAEEAGLTEQPFEELPPLPEPADTEMPVIDDTEPEPIPAPTPTPTPEPAFSYGMSGTFDTSVTEFYGIIVASVASESNALSLRNELREEGFRAHHYSLRLPEAGLRWRVVVGQFENREDAIEAAVSLPAPYRNNYFTTNIRL